MSFGPEMANETESSHTPAGGGTAPRCPPLGRPSLRLPLPGSVHRRPGLSRPTEAVRLRPRVPGTKVHEKTADWLVKQLTPLAARVTRQRFTVTVRGKALPMTNIIATFNPKGKEHVLLCADWDTRPIADHDPNPANRKTPIPGANDGASGVAVLLEIARALKAAPPKQQVTLVLFDGEDYGPGVDDMFLGFELLRRTLPRRCRRSGPCSWT